MCLAADPKVSTPTNANKGTFDVSAFDFVVETL